MLLEECEEGIGLGAPGFAVTIEAVLDGKQVVFEVIEGFLAVGALDIAFVLTAVSLAHLGREYLVGDVGAACAKHGLGNFLPGCIGASFLGGPKQILAVGLVGSVHGAVEFRLFHRGLLSLGSIGVPTDIEFVQVYHQVFGDSGGENEFFLAGHVLSLEFGCIFSSLECCCAAVGAVAEKYEFDSVES